MSAIETMDEQSLIAVDVRQDVLSRYNSKIQARLAKTVWNRGGCTSWYLDPNGKNTALWPGFTLSFRKQLRTFDLDDYRAESANR
jgi:cyclohexanone monooxygenase